MITEILFGFIAVSVLIMQINLFLISKRLDRFSTIVDLLINDYIDEALDKREESKNE